MRRIAIVIALLLVVGGLALTTVRVDSDARALLGADAATAGALDTPEGRALTLAIILPDRDRRSAIAREVVEELAGDPMVGRVTLVPELSEQGLDWLWQHRFVLAPPPEAAFTPAALATELRRARRAFTDAAAEPFAGRYLLDPTGSFRRLVENVALRREALTIYEGVPQARDDSAALLFIELAEHPFDTAVQGAFDRRLRALVAELGAEPLLVGPRSISAAVSADIAERATLSTIVASGLLLLWLAAVLRSAKGVLASVLPAGLGLAAAALLVQLTFGHVHVLALGFGGALIGLALDYPLHLMAHGRAADVAHAKRCVRIGAATTVIAFLALWVADIPAIVQVGLFVAAGLTAAASAALWMAADLPRARGSILVAPELPLHHKLAVLTAVILAGIMGVILLPTKGAEQLGLLPAEMQADIDRLHRMIDLPSGRFRIEVAGTSLAEVLERQVRLAKLLDEARGAGRLGHFEMLATLLPRRVTHRALPPAERLSQLLAGPLTAAGLRPSFRADISNAYNEALKRRDVAPADLPVGGFAAAGRLIRRDAGGFVAPALLWDVADPLALASATAALDDPAIRFVDQGAEIAGGFDRLADRVRLSVVIGAVAALGFLVMAIRRLRAVVEIAAGCLAAALVTVCLAGLTAGGIGIFHILALALVVGIGIDYGLLLTLSGDTAQFGAAVGSVLLCATSTLIAFITMALSGVGVLEDIGTTVAIGVLAMLAINAVRSQPTGAR